MSGKIYIFFNFKLKYIFKINKTKTICFKRCIIGAKTIYLTKETEGETEREIKNLRDPAAIVHSVLCWYILVKAGIVSAKIIFSKI